MRCEYDKKEAELMERIVSLAAQGKVKEIEELVEIKENLWFLRK